MHGKGKYTDKNGNIYEGDYMLNIREGKGVYTELNKFKITVYTKIRGNLNLINQMESV